MRRHSEVTLVAGVVLISLALTGLTVWSVYQQGEALQAREWADLRSTARAAADQCRSALMADAQTACDVLDRLWQAQDAGGLDLWVASQRIWTLAVVAGDADRVQSFPLTPFEPRPQPRSRLGGSDAAEEGDPNAATPPRGYLQRLTGGADPLARVTALLASALREERGGYPAVAARIIADAAQVLRSTPDVARSALQTELARIEDLLKAKDFQRASEVLGELLTALLGEHPGRLGPAELEPLERFVAAVALPGQDPLKTLVARLRDRVERRTFLLSALGPAARERAAALGTGVEIELRAVRSERGEWGLLVLRGAPASRAVLGLAAPTRELLARYTASPGRDTRWRVATLDAPVAGPALAELGPALGDAVLVPSDAALAALDAHGRQRLQIVLGTALGSVGAWGLVIWLMLRAIARQRELVTLQRRFVADMSHELKTPLALIRLLAETLTEGRVSDAERLRRYHETISRETERLTALLDNILDIGRIESGRKHFEFGPCDIEQVARRAWALFEPQFAKEGFEARLEIQPHLPTMKADAAALQQVLVNLLQNAHRYGGSGKYVRLSVGCEGHTVLIEVEDRGIGMSRAELNRLGQTFFRADDARVRQQRGTGLGLAIVRHVLAAHGGKIDVHSRPEHGTRFTIWIPLEPPAAATGSSSR